MNFKRGGAGKAPTRPTEMKPTAPTPSGKCARRRRELERPLVCNGVVSRVLVGDRPRWICGCGCFSTFESMLEGWRLEALCYWRVDLRDLTGSQNMECRKDMDV